MCSVCTALTQLLCIKLLIMCLQNFVVPEKVKLPMQQRIHDRNKAIKARKNSKMEQRLKEAT
jgi:hypothetical protein